ncbi:uncharacterized protein [Amphiura filiformis]|uniref:uncharacterized protein isoform X1 n=1 Tax=Amphiura filiformis TaxID=82378 RepID=UPI003B215031
MKRDGKDTSKHYPPITTEDLSKMFDTKVLSMNNPQSLQRLVFFQCQYFFCRRGREGLRDLKRDSFAIKQDASGKEYITMTFNEHQKNHPGTLNETYQMNKRVYETGEDNCPVRAFKLYLSKLHPSCEWFYQRPKRLASGAIWYDNIPVGHNTIGNMMTNISKAANLSQIYTNHSIRAAAITVLNNAGFSDRTICSLSGHRNSSSLKSYCSDASDGQKRNMTQELSRQQRKIPRTATLASPTVSLIPASSIRSPANYTIAQPAPLGLPTIGLPTTSAMPMIPAQPSLTSAVVRRPPNTMNTASSASTSSAANVVNMVNPQNLHPMFTNCNFQGATLNFHFGQ